MSTVIGTAVSAPMTIGDPAWAQTLTASKIAAVLGLSRWDSPFSIWHKMAGNASWNADENLDEKRRGHYLEPAVRQWYREHHPNYQVDKNVSTFVHKDRPWQGASPDGIVLRRNVERTPIGLFEGKTDNLYWQWGEEGTDQIPAGYRAQCMWQMDVFGLPFVDVAVLDSNLTFREYRVEYDAAAAADMRARALDFLDSLHTGRQPGLDAHGETYRVVRELHPDIDNVTVDIDPGLAVRYVNAVSALEIAQEDLAEKTTLLADAIGTGRAGICNDIVLATRISKAGSTPFLRRSNGLTSKFTLIEKEAS